MKGPGNPSPQLHRDPERFKAFRQRLLDGEAPETLGPAFGIKPTGVRCYARRMGLHTCRFYMQMPKRPR